MLVLVLVPVLVMRQARMLLVVPSRRALGRDSSEVRAQNITTRYWHVIHLACQSPTETSRKCCLRCVHEGNDLRCLRRGLKKWTYHEHTAWFEANKSTGHTDSIQNIYTTWHQLAALTLTLAPAV